MQIGEDHLLLHGRPVPGKDVRRGKGGGHVAQKARVKLGENLLRHRPQRGKAAGNAEMGFKKALVPPLLQEQPLGILPEVPEGKGFGGFSRPALPVDAVIRDVLRDGDGVLPGQPAEIQVGPLFLGQGKQG